MFIYLFRLNEFFFLLRKKISCKVPQTVGLTMQLIGALVNNGGSRFHAALNDAKFIYDIGNAVRYFGKRTGPDNRKVVDTSLDLIQSWGEAFLPHRRDYYNIVDLYFNLRKEGMPFKPQQFDPSRVPIFVQPLSGGGGGGGGDRDNTDAILAAAMHSSMQLEQESSRGLTSSDRAGNGGGSGGNSNNRYRDRQDDYVSTINSNILNFHIYTSS
jgi:hypothetical protein